MQKSSACLRLTPHPLVKFRPRARCTCKMVLPRFLNSVFQQPQKFVSISWLAG
ncbi:hypothetical protein HanPSC8_Chr04g0176811 [Helianthus annuus]|nr:hypothetical protein HanPSC8_Chr04g0176811 [Helianthus annuus]